MKYRVVIFDDEPLIVAGLTENIDWETLDCEVAGKAYNGIDAISVINDVRPDIIISDIVMPGKTGLEIAEWCVKKRLNSRLIFLSAYSDFGYAQKAIRLGVCDYVLKPIDTNKLISAIKKAVASLENLMQEEKHLSTLKNTIETVKPIVSSSVLFDVARYGVNILKGEYKELSHTLTLDAGVVICVKLYNLPRQAGNAIKPEIQRKYASQFNEDGLTLIRGSADDKMIFISLLPTGIDLKTGQKRVAESANKAGEKISEDENIICVSVISSPYRNSEELHERYLECLKILPVSFFEEKSGTLVIDSTYSPPASEVPNVDELLHFLSNGNTAMLEKELNSLFTKLRRLKDREVAVHTFRYLHRKATGIASKAGMQRKPQMNSDYVMENFAFMSKNIASYLLKISDYIQAGQNTLSKLKLIVEENYSSADFGLTEAADIMGISSSYLSRLFKKETGENFLDYLTRVRIERAKYLLETTTLNNSEIASQVGFDSAHYFAQVFKKKCGTTPNKFRKLNS